MIVETLYDSINQGRKGLNKGLNSGSKKLDSIVYGIQRRAFYTIGADSGAGKSTFMLYSAIYNPFIQYLKSNKTIKIHFLLFSFELSAGVVFAKLLTTHIYDEYHVVISYEQILSLTEPLNDDLYHYVELSKDWMTELESVVEVIDTPCSAGQIYGITKEWTQKFGKYEQITENKTKYIHNNANQYLIVVLDHLGLIKKGTQGLKSEIDEACTYLITLRNKCDLTVFAVQQLNRGFKQMDRRTNGYSAIELQDFKDSSGSTDASEVVIGLFYPYREKMSKCEGYDIRQLKDRARIIYVLKNRFGMSDKAYASTFFGECGIFKDLPLPNEINDYEPYTKL